MPVKVEKMKKKNSFVCVCVCVGGGSIYSQLLHYRILSKQFITRVALYYAGTTNVIVYCFIRRTVLVTVLYCISILSQVAIRMYPYYHLEIFVLPLWDLLTELSVYFNILRPLCQPETIISRLTGQGLLLNLEVAPREA